MRSMLAEGLFLVLGVCCVSVFAKADRALPAVKRPAVKLEVAFIVDAGSPTLSFTVENAGATSIHRGELMLNSNGVYALRDDGVGFAAYTIADDFGPRKTEAGVIKPGGTVTWTIAMETLCKRLRIENSGTYKMYWEFYVSGQRTRSTSITLIRKTDKAGTDGIVRRRVGSLRSPKDTAKTFYAALGGNMSDLQHSLGADVNKLGEKEAFNALYGEALGAEQFKSAAVNKFGAQTVGDWAPDDMEPTLRDMDQAEVVLSDDLDHAELIVNPRWTLHFTRRKFDWWQIDVSNFMRDGLPYPQIPKRAEILSKMAVEIQAGEYGTFKEANGELARRIDEAIGVPSNSDSKANRKPKEGKPKKSGAANRSSKSGC